MIEAVVLDLAEVCEIGGIFACKSNRSIAEREGAYVGQKSFRVFGGGFVSANFSGSRGVVFVFRWRHPERYGFSARQGWAFSSATGSMPR